MWQAFSTLQATYQIKFIIYAKALICFRHLFVEGLKFETKADVGACMIPNVLSLPYFIRIVLPIV